LFPPERRELTLEERGAIYTKEWVVDLILDLAGFTSDQDLAAARTVEPACGEGSFLVPMVRRFVASCRRFGRALDGCWDAIVAFELDGPTAAVARQSVSDALTAEGVQRDQAVALATAWIQTGDYLGSLSRLPQADFVIGNPPYVRLENLPDNVLAFYRASYSTMKGRADLYVGFFEAALRQLAPGGVCAFICADRWMLNQYGATLRDLVTSDFSLQTIVEMHEAEGFLSDVSAYPAITVIRRSDQREVVVARADSQAESATPGALVAAIQRVRTSGRARLPAGLAAARLDGWFRGTEPWPLVAPNRLALLRALERDFAPLESEATGTRVGIGVATGCDRVFITSDPSLVETSRLLPLALGDDIRSGALQWSGHYLVNPWDDAGLVSLADFPRFHAYLGGYRAELAGRHCARERAEQWHRTIDRVDPSLVARPKLYVPDIKGCLHPVLDEGGTYPHHNLYFVVSDTWDLCVLGGLLMSRLAQFFVECYSVRMRGGYLRFQAQYLRRIRVPFPAQVSASQATALRRAFLDRDVDAASTIAAEVYGIEDFRSGGSP
jgi:hypothetical protein